MPALPLVSEARRGVARWSIEGDKFSIEFDNLTIGGLHLAYSDNDSLPDLVNWSKPWIGLRDCIDFFDLSNLPSLEDSSSCEWYSNNAFENRTNVLEVRPADPHAISIGDELTLRSYVVYGFYANLSSWAFAPTTTYTLQVPQPLLPPAVELYIDTGAKIVPSTSYDVPICDGLRLDAFLLDTRHGGLPLYTWSASGSSCSYTSSLSGIASDFSPNHIGLQTLETLLQNSSAGGSPLSRGSSSLRLPRTALEPGCAYTISFQLRSRWGPSTTQSFTLAKQGPPLLVDWTPTCAYHCNAATCEPPSSCVDGKCVCVSDRWGPLCREECSCSPYTAAGCNATTGTCICVRGRYGDDCSRSVEWKAVGWGECLPCGSTTASQSNVLECVISNTDTVVDDSYCPSKPAALTQSCVPQPCPCIEIPSLPGLSLASLQRCNGTSSGGRCTASCQSGFLTLGEFRCYAGAFIEVPTCVAAGSSVASFPAVHIGFRMLSRPASSLDTDAYLDEVSSPLRSMISNSLSPLAWDDITFRIRNLSQDEVHSLTSSQGHARRLAIIRVEVSATVAIKTGQSSDAQLMANKLGTLTRSNQLVQTFNSIFSMECGQSCRAGSIEYLIASEPQTTRVYLVPATTHILSTTALIAQSASLGVSLSEQQSETNFSVVLIVSITTSVAVGLLCVLAILGVWWWRQRRKLMSYVKPFKDEQESDIASLSKEQSPESSSSHCCLPMTWVINIANETDVEAKEKRKAEKLAAKIAKEEDKQAKKELAEARKREKAAAKLAQEEERKEIALKVEAEKRMAKLFREQELQAQEEAAEKMKLEQMAAKMAQDEENRARKEAAEKQIDEERQAAKVAKERDEKAKRDASEQLKADKLAAKERDEKAKRDASEQLKADKLAAKERDEKAKRDASEKLKADKLAAKMLAEEQARAKAEAAAKLKQDEKDAVARAKEQALRSKMEAAEKVKAEKAAAKLAQEQEKQAKKEAAERLKAENAAAKLAKEQEKQEMREKDLRAKKEAAEKLKAEKANVISDQTAGREAAQNRPPGVPDFDMMELDDRLVDWRDPF